MKHFFKGILMTSLALAGVNTLIAQVEFTDKSNKLTTNNYSGCSVAVTDWNGDGLDDIIRLNQGRNVIISVQKVNQSYEDISLGSMGSSSAWSMVVADFDKNGYVDVVAGWSGSAKVMMMNNTGTAGNIITLPNSNFFLQNMTVIDLNNDGWADLFTCDDNGQSSIYMNDGAGNLFDGTNDLATQGIIDFDVTSTDDSGNYGSVWTDFDNDGDMDLYVAHCRQGVNSPTDGRRINVMFVNNGDGTYTEDAAEYGINVGWQSWTASFGDIDNDGDFDLLLTNHDYESQILENDGTGHYTDITATTGFDISDITPIESTFADFDNDGFVDILISGSNSRYFHNNGDRTFSQIMNVFNTNSMLTFATGDINHDGRVDVFAGYGSIYTNPSSTVNDVVWINTTSNNNHFFALNLHGTVSNSDAIGAKARIYGSWGVQIREVRSGENYGTANSTKLSFGLGSATEIDSLVIDWPSGMHQVIENPTTDQFMSVIEAQCISPDAIVSTDGELVLCGTQATVTLNAPSGFEYVWSTGETTQTISVSEAGDYNVNLIPSSSACSVESRVITISQSPDETPSVAVVGDTQFCDGGQAMIEGPAGLSSYTWSNGETGSSINVTESGEYTLTIQGSCAEFTSEPITVNVVSPDAPIADNVVITEAGAANLIATGTNLTWFDAEIDGNVIGTGNSIESPVVTENTTFYVQSETSFGGGSETVGLTAPEGNSYGQGSTNSAVYFDVNSACTLLSFDVSTDTPGLRKFDIYNNNDQIEMSVSMTLPEGISTVDLSASLLPGTGYYILADVAVNQTTTGTNSPRLVRESSQTAFEYPYNAGGALEITGTTYGSGYYFYFYNWQVELSAEVCTSELVPVTVTIDNSTGIQSPNSLASIFPNPAKEFIRIKGLNSSANVSIVDAAGRLVSSSQVSADGIVSLSNITSGIYFVRVISNGEVSTHRVVKQ
jgi:hypothetical protein